MQNYFLQSAVMDAFHERLRWARERMFESAVDAAKALGVPYGTYTGHESGARGAKNDDIERYAKKFKVPAGWLAFAEGADGLLEVPVVGYVRGGNEAFYYGEGQGPFGMMPLPPEGSLHTVAVTVQGNSMRGVADDGYTIYYDERHDPPDTNLIGSLCVVGLPDGKVLVKKLMPGRGPGLFDLHSTNEDPMLDQPVQWAAKVIWIKPR
jgi:phage repressor protein C with HTH and peptisase S24 domain